MVLPAIFCLEPPVIFHVQSTWQFIIHRAPSLATTNLLKTPVATLRSRSYLPLFMFGAMNPILQCDKRLFVILVTSEEKQKPRNIEEGSKMADGNVEFRLVSPGISHHDGRLQRKYTDEGQGALKNISPPLEWYSLPKGTKSLALVVQDIDAPDPDGPIVPWTCWVVANIPPTLNWLPEGLSGKVEEMGGEYAGIKEGNNDLKTRGWHVPKLPTHQHRLEFKLYALDDELHLGNKVTKEKLLEAIEGHVLGEAVLIAKF